MLLDELEFKLEFLVQFVQNMFILLGQGFVELEVKDIICLFFFFVIEVLECSWLMLLDDIINYFNFFKEVFFLVVLRSFWVNVGLDGEEMRVQIVQKFLEFLFILEFFSLL